MKKLLLLVLVVILLFTTSCTTERFEETEHISSGDSSKLSDTEELVTIWLCTKAYYTDDTTEKMEMLLCEYDKRGNLTKSQSNYDSEVIITYEHLESEGKVIFANQSIPDSDDVTAEFNENGNPVLMYQGEYVASYKYDEQERLTEYTVKYNNLLFTAVSINYNEQKNLIECHINDNYYTIDFDYTSGGGTAILEEAEYYENGNLKKFTLGSEEEGSTIYTFSENGCLKSVNYEGSHIIEYEYRKIRISTKDAKRVQNQNIALVKNSWFKEAFLGQGYWQMQDDQLLIDDYIRCYG